MCESVFFFKWLFCNHQIFLGVPLRVGLFIPIFCKKKAKGFSLLSLTQNTASNAVFSKCYHFSVPANKKVDLKRLLFLIFGKPK